jgi:hypothetical protein|tara:strand:+ start:66 stop:233 length:168 start_codon:yes stop_codon:yes gene_type:complete
MIDPTDLMGFLVIAVGINSGRTSLWNLETKGVGECVFKEFLKAETLVLEFVNLAP